MNTVLIANRGEIARRVIRTCRDLGYRTVAVYSDVDRAMPFVVEADVAVRIGEGPASTSYLDPERILAAAARTGADAIHPGYGFLAENADFAQAVVNAGLTWIGPPASAIRAMGDKAAAKQLASRRGVPVLPGYAGDDQSLATLRTEAVRIGFPVLVKAVAGGGGRGMRRVDSLDDLDDAVASARREAASAFGSDVVLLEKLVPSPRHVEVQVFGDAHGNVIHLGERECSIQRRHQKIIEEAPSPAVDAGLRQRLGAAAIEVARAVGYIGAGTVETLLAPDGGFWFLEMNTRLQVEHPVTEEVTGLDLVELQVRVAAGEALPPQSAITMSGHAIEARVYAEDPMRDYLPATGRIRRLHIPRHAGIRVDAGYAAGNDLPMHYDAMIAKVIAIGPTRAVASRRLSRCLERAWIPGPASNLALLRQILRTEAWNSADLHTGFLHREGLPQPPPLNLERGAIAATALGWWLRRSSSPWPAQVTSGWRVEGPTWSADTWSSFGEAVEARWRTMAESLEIAVGDHTHRVEVLGRDGDELRLVIDGLHTTWRVSRCSGATGQLCDGDTVYAHLGDGEAMLTLAPRHPIPQPVVEPGTCTASTPGTVVKVHVAVGDAVTAGQALVVIEAMKMEHTVNADQDGTVEAVAVAVGDTVDQGEVVVRIG